MRCLRNGMLHREPSTLSSVLQAHVYSKYNTLRRQYYTIYEYAQ